MKITLDYWLIRWRSIAFEPDKGIGKVRWLSRKPKNCRGWATKYKDIWFAIWNSSTGLIFQVGDRRWELNNSECTHVVQGSKCIFEIRKSGNVEYKLEYDVPKDIVLDNLDFEMNDFFYWVSKVWNDSSLRGKFTSSWKVKEI